VDLSGKPAWIQAKAENPFSIMDVGSEEIPKIMNEENTLSKFDRTLAGLQGGNNLPTKPTTIEHITFTGEAETFVVQTIRDEKGDHIVIKFIDKDGVKRIICPPRVSNTIAAQRDALTKSRRRINGKTAAQARKDRGELPGFMRRPAAATTVTQ
jgi:hypothetical protein